MYRLTKEGERYTEEGTPERRLIKFLSDEGEAPMERVNREVEDGSVAINWSIKNGWIDVEDGTVRLKKKPQRFPLEMALLKVKSGEEVDDEKIEILDERGLIDEIRDDVVKKAKEQAEKGNIASLTPELIKTGLWRDVELKEYDVQKTGKRKHPGKKHILSHYIQKIRKIFLEMGFEEKSGPFVESSFWNFDALYQPQDHPARELADTFYMEKPDRSELPNQKTVNAVKRMHEEGDTDSEGWGYDWKEEITRRPVLRTHTTAVTARALKNIEPPAKVFTVDKAFRNETLDYSHLPEFIQVDGIVADESVSFRDLLGYLKEFYKKLGFEKVRFRPGYFPYTEMSVEPEVYFEEKDEWLEMGGSGIFRPEVTRPLGIDVPVLAWGLGLERPVMLDQGIDDIRNFYFENDLKLLKEAKI